MFRWSTAWRMRTLRKNASEIEDIVDQIRLFNQKGTLLDLAGTKNSSRTDRRRKKGRFEINRFQFFSTLISIQRHNRPTDKH